MSRWLTWTPEAPIIEKTPNPPLPKLTKPDCVSSVSAHLDPFPIIEPAGGAPKGDPDPMMGDPCPCGSREWWKLAGPTVECKACGRTVRLGGSAPTSCYNHGAATTWWQQPWGDWVCRRCHPSR
jgi:hypothetical protein